jgi:hypothetical protein
MSNLRKAVMEEEAEYARSYSAIFFEHVFKMFPHDPFNPRT